ncbi:hypothetical protein V6N13_010822 [Hibiscus sabdariffa]|uniref:Cardiomyopathy-associated protein 5 n=1 Tax=Hibiscus sabdariffa TaxID=183260 RepID=A0ABR2SAB9_9ROSI
MYSSPILICTAIAIRFYWKTKQPEVQVVKKKDSEERSSADANRSKEEKPSPDVNRSKAPSLRHQKSVRRNARMEVLEWDRDDSPDILFSRSIYDILPAKSSLLEENSKLALDVNGRSNMELGESSSKNETRNDQAPNAANSLFDNGTLKHRSVAGDSFGGQSGKSLDDGGGGGGGAGGVVDVERLEERRKAEDVAVPEDRNKAVEWTKEDEKNLMDLGTERNKRLESLMTKRRARKLFKMAVEKSLKDKGINPQSQIAPILIVKNNILGASNNANDEGLQMPGSAPSVLLPTQNPFDLPYDPFEEKPNLTADSFQQEFMPANQKETLFCRHESFCHGPLFTFDTTPDPNDQFNPYYGAEKRLVGGPAVDRFRRSPDDEGGLHRHNSMGFGSEIDVIELEESHRNEAMNSPGEKVEKITETADDKTEIGENNETPRDLSGSEVRLDIDSTKNNDSCCYSPSSSDDSESGLDQTTKPLSLCTSQVRKALNLSIPPKGRTVSKLPFDYSPSPRRAEFNLFYNTHRRLGHVRNCSVASDLQVEVSEVGSTTLSTDGTVSPVEGDATYDGDIERDINSDSEELWPGSFNLTREANREKLRELDDIIEEDSVELKLSGLNKKPDEPIASIFPSEQETMQNLNNTSSLSSRLDTTEDDASYPANINHETHEYVIRRGEEDNGFKSTNVSDKLSPEDLGKTMQLTEKSVVPSPPETCFQKPEQLSDPQKKTMAINLDSCEYKDGNIETSYESTRTMDSQKEMGESQPSKYMDSQKDDTEDAPNAFQSRDQSPKNIGHDTPNLTEYNNGDAPNAVQGIVNQNIAEDNVSGVEQRLESSIAMPPTQRLAIEQTYLSSHESPRSVLPQNILVERIPVSNVEQQRQTDQPQFVMEDVERYNSASNQPQESSTFNMPQISQQLVENSIDHSSSNLNPGTLEGSSSTTDKSPNGSPVHNMNELVLESTHGKEDSKINPDFNEHLGGSKKQTEHNSGTDPSKSKEGNAKSDDPKIMVTEKSEEEVDRICNVNESLTNMMTNNESSNYVLDGEGEPQISSRQKAIMEPSRTGGETSAESVKDTEHESRTLAKTDASAGLPTSKGESLSRQESFSGALESKDDNPKVIGESISGEYNPATGMSNLN